jgi:hypothetical protein
MAIDISEEHIASIFRFEEKAKQEQSVKSGIKLANCSTLTSVFICK